MGAYGGIDDAVGEERNAHIVVGIDVERQGNAVINPAYPRSPRHRPAPGVRGSVLQYDGKAIRAAAGAISAGPSLIDERDLEPVNIHGDAQPSGLLLGSRPVISMTSGRGKWRPAPASIDKLPPHTVTVERGYGHDVQGRGRAGYRAAVRVGDFDVITRRIRRLRVGDGQGVAGGAGNPASINQRHAIGPPLIGRRRSHRANRQRTVRPAYPTVSVGRSPSG